MLSETIQITFVRGCSSFMVFLPLFPRSGVKVCHGNAVVNQVNFSIGWMKASYFFFPFADGLDRASRRGVP